MMTHPQHMKNHFGLTTEQKMALAPSNSFAVSVPVRFSVALGGALIEAPYQAAITPSMASAQPQIHLFGCPVEIVVALVIPNFGKLLLHCNFALAGDGAAACFIPCGFVAADSSLPLLAKESESRCLPAPIGATGKVTKR